MKTISIGVAQIEVSPAMPQENARKIARIAEELRSQGAEILVFPELCIPGYLIGDSWERDSFLRECESANQQLCQMTKKWASDTEPGALLIFGTVQPNWKERGEDGRVRKYNAVHLCQAGNRLKFPGLERDYGIKTLLPNYREFDETRHFYDLRRLAMEKGCAWEALLEPISVQLCEQNFRLGIVLCEDAWDDDYVQKPLSVLADKKCELIVNLSCSPYTRGKKNKRNRVFSNHAKSASCPMLYVNSIGLQNNGKTLFTFDGCSTMYSDEGEIVWEKKSLEESIEIIGFEIQSQKLKTDNETEEKPEIKTESSDTKNNSQVGDTHSPKAVTQFADPFPDETYQALEFGLDRFLQQTGLRRIVIGSSGGIDSAVSAALYARVIEAKNLLLVNMPSRFNSQTTIQTSRQLADNLGCLYAELPIENSMKLTESEIQGLRVSSIDGSLSETLKLDAFHMENVQARDRSSRVLAAMASAFGGGFTCNANKTELTVGYSTLYGDLGGVAAILGDLWKGEVYALGRYLNAHVYKSNVIPETCFTLPPSAELSLAQAVDEGKGDPLIYPYHDRLFHSWVQRWKRCTPEENLEWYIEGRLENELGLSMAIRDLFAKPQDFINDLEKWWNLYNGMAVAKRIQAPPILALSPRAFGFDHREAQGPIFYSQRYREMKKKVLNGKLSI